MTLTTTSERLSAALARSHELWDARSQVESHATAVAPAAFSVAFSREAGTDAAEVAAQLAARLGWPVYDRELLRLIAEQTGVRAPLLEGVDERRAGWVASLFAGFSSGSVVHEDAYVHRLARVVQALADRGECILIGRGAAQVLPSQRTLRVRLVAPLAERVRAFARRHNIGRDEAARRVDEIDRDRNHFVRETYHKDPTDPRGYDLILNTARFSAGECADLIEQALLRVQARAHAGAA